MNEQLISFATKHGGGDHEPSEQKELFDHARMLHGIDGLSKELVTGIVREAEVLMNTPEAIQRKPSLNTGDNCKYLVAAKACAPCIKTNHSLCIVEKSQMPKLHIKDFKKSLSQSGLVVPENAAPGKKGGTT